MAVEYDDVQRRTGDMPVRVLLADDTADLRVLVRLALEAAGGFEIIAEAADGLEALRLTEQHAPDLAVVDVAMPLLGGLQAIPEMRRLAPAMHIAVLTVFDLVDLRASALAAGADVCLDKTNPPSELVRALAELAGIRAHLDGDHAAEAWATQALRESLAGFKGAFDEATIGMALTDFDCRPLRVNQALCRILGTTPEEAMSRPLTERVHPDHAPLAPIPWGQLPPPTDPPSAPVECCWIRADGASVWVTVDWVPVPGLDGQPLYLFCQVQDVSARRRAQDDLRASEERYRLLSDNATDLIAVYGADTVLRYASPSIRTILGYEPEELIGRRLSDIWHAAEVERVALGHHRPEVDSFNVRVQRKDGSWVWLEVCRRLIVDAAGGNLIEIHTASRDITERKVLEARLTELAMHDGLTGLANRALLMDRLDHALARREESGGQVAVLFVDLDRFKVVNDTLGHAAGDAVLKTTADRLQATVRPMDTAARLGGDEFVVVCEGLSGEEEAISVAERIEASVAEPHHVAERSIVVTASVGIVLAPPGADGERLVHRADSAMYDAKQAGRARHCVWR